MIDPVSLIVTALVQAVTQEAVSDGYDVLKGYIVRRYGRRVQPSLARLETRPQSREYQEELAQQLREVGAGNNPELVGLARQLIDLVVYPEQAIEPETVQPDPVEELRRTTGMTAVGQLLQDHVNSVLSIRSKYHLEDRDLLCANIRSNTNVPQAVRESAAGLHDRMWEIVQRVAASIEDGRYREVEAAVTNLPAGLAERHRAARLVQVDKQMHISYETLRVTVEYFSELNRSVLARIETERDRNRQANMMFGNAVMIYELTDFVIGYIRSFALGDDIDALRAEARQRVDEVRKRQKDFERRMHTRKVEPAIRDQTLANIRHRGSAFDELDREWDRYLSEVGNMRAKVEEVRLKLDTLETIREDAELQIMTLQLVAMLNILRQGRDSMRGAVDTLQGFRLARLDASRVCRLLGIDIAR